MGWGGWVGRVGWKVEDGRSKMDLRNVANSLQTEWHRVLHGNLYHMVG